MANLWQGMYLISSVLHHPQVDRGPEQRHFSFNSQAEESEFSEAAILYDYSNINNEKVEEMVSNMNQGIGYSLQQICIIRMQYYILTYFLSIAYLGSGVLFIC